MPEYRFSLTHILLYKDKIAETQRFCLFTGLQNSRFFFRSTIKYVSEKTRIQEYFTQPLSDFLRKLLSFISEAGICNYTCNTILHACVKYFNNIKYTLEVYVHKATVWLKTMEWQLQLITKDFETFPLLTQFPSPQEKQNQIIITRSFMQVLLPELTNYLKLRNKNIGNYARKLENR